MNKVYYNQADPRWANHPYTAPSYSNATVKSSGCGPTCGAMVISSCKETIYPDASYLHTEEIKNEVISLLTTPGIIKVQGKLVVKEAYERFENIYRGYTIQKIYNEFVYGGQDLAAKDKQFFMYPFGGLRVEFEMTTRELCQPYII